MGANRSLRLVPLSRVLAEVVGSHFPDDSAFAGKDFIPTLKELLELADGAIEAFAVLIDYGKS